MLERKSTPVETMSCIPSLDIDKQIHADGLKQLGARQKRCSRSKAPWPTPPAIGLGVPVGADAGQGQAVASQAKTMNIK